MFVFRMSRYEKVISKMVFFPLSCSELLQFLLAWLTFVNSTGQVNGWHWYTDDWCWAHPAAKATTWTIFECGINSCAQYNDIVALRYFLHLGMAMFSIHMELLPEKVGRHDKQFSFMRMYICDYEVCEIRSAILIYLASTCWPCWVMTLGTRIMHRDRDCHVV